MELANKTIDVALQEVQRVREFYKDPSLTRVEHDMRKSKDMSLRALSDLFSASKNAKKDVPTRNEWESLIDGFRGADVDQSFLKFGVERYLQLVSDNRPPTVDDARAALKIVETNLQTLRLCVHVLYGAKIESESHYMTHSNIHAFDIRPSSNQHVETLRFLRNSIPAHRLRSHDQMLELLRQGESRGRMIEVNGTRGNTVTIGSFVYEFHESDPEGKILIRDLGARHGRQIPEIVSAEIMETLGHNHWKDANGKIIRLSTGFHFNELICDVHR